MHTTWHVLQTISVAPRRCYTSAMHVDPGVVTHRGFRKVSERYNNLIAKSVRLYEQTKYAQTSTLDQLEKNILKILQQDLLFDIDLALILMHILTKIWQRALSSLCFWYHHPSCDVDILRTAGKLCCDF